MPIMHRVAAEGDEIVSESNGRRRSTSSNRDIRPIGQRENGSGPLPIVVSSSSEPSSGSEFIDGGNNIETNALASSSSNSAPAGTTALSTEALEAAFPNANIPAVRIAVNAAGFCLSPNYAQAQNYGQQGSSMHQGMASAMMLRPVVPYQFVSPVAVYPQVPQANMPLLPTNTLQTPVPNRYANGTSMYQPSISQMTTAPVLVLAPLQPPQLQLQQPQPLMQQQQQHESFPMTSLSSALRVSTPSIHIRPPSVAATNCPPSVGAQHVRNQGDSSSNGANFARRIPTQSTYYQSSNRRPSTSSAAKASSAGTRQARCMPSNPVLHKPEAKQLSKSRPSTSSSAKGSSAGTKRSKSMPNNPASHKPDTKRRKRPVTAHDERGRSRTSTSSTADSTSPPPRSKKSKRSKNLKRPKQTGKGRSMPLIMPNDTEWLTTKECFLRTHCFELFTATNDDVVSAASGRRNPVSLGQVGIRCVYCAKDPANMRAQRPMCFPSSIRTMQKAFVNLVHLHFPACTKIPSSVRATYESLKSTHSPMGSNEYRIESMKSVLDDVETGGVRFKDNITADNLPDAPGKIVFGCDKPYATDFDFRLFEQMRQCHFSSHDRASPGCAHKLGYTGLACIHCSEAKVLGGRFFPASPHALNSAYEAGHFYEHILECPNCPQSVKDRLLEMKEKQEDQRKELEAGSKEEFFQRVWLRFHKSFNGKVYNSDN